MKRRSFVTLLGSAIATLPFFSSPAAGSFLSSPVALNRLRPPGAVAEDIFAGKCIRCGRCVEVCPYRSIIMLDIRAGVFAGTPLVEAEKIPCYLCMKCVEVCPTGSLQPLGQQEVRMGLAVIDKFTCTTWSGLVLCRTCYDICPLKDQAIRLDELRPVIDEQNCTGCGMCTHACPVTTEDGNKAVNIEPIYSTGR